MENGNKERKRKLKKEIKYFVKKSMFKIQQQKKGKQRPLTLCSSSSLYIPWNYLCYLLQK